MNKLIDTTQKQILRGEILKICNELQGTGAGVPLMYACFKKAGIICTQNDIVEACRYLLEKGLIDFRHIRSEQLNAERDIAYITFLGTDVLEADSPTTGIILE